MKNLKIQNLVPPTISFMLPLSLNISKNQLIKIKIFGLNFKSNTLNNFNSFLHMFWDR
jgi:hypothetical protein